MANIDSDKIDVKANQLAAIPKDSLDLYDAQQARAQRNVGDFKNELTAGIGNTGLLGNANENAIQESALGGGANPGLQEALNNRAQQGYQRSLNDIIQQSGQEAMNHKMTAMGAALKVKQAQQGFNLENQGIQTQSQFRQQSENLEMQKISQLRQQQVVDIERMKQQKNALIAEYQRQLKIQQRDAVIAGILGVIGTGTGMALAASGNPGGGQAKDQISNAGGSNYSSSGGGGGPNLGVDYSMTS